VDDDGAVMPSDVGLARSTEQDGLRTTSPYVGTLRYQAPELDKTTENSFPRVTLEGDILAALYFTYVLAENRYSIDGLELVCYKVTSIRTTHQVV